MDDIYFKLRPLSATSADELCDCIEVKEIYLAHKLGSNPIHCLRCNGEIPPEKLAYDQTIADNIASWNSIYGAIYTLWLASGEYEQWAREKLLDPEGQVNKDGIQLVKKLDHYAKAYYLWFREMRRPRTDGFLAG